MHFNTYKHHEDIIGPVIEETAKESCLRAALEEKQLLLKNQHNICKQLPPEIALQVYPSMNPEDLQYEIVSEKNRNKKNENDPNSEKSPINPISSSTSDQSQEVLSSCQNGTTTQQEQ